MEVFTLCASSLLVLFLSIILYYVFFFQPKAKVSPQNTRSVLLFIDAADPDNFAAAAATVKHLLTDKLRPLGDVRVDPRLHVVLTGRPVDLKTTKSSDDVPSLEMLIRQKWETNNPLHAQKVLEDAAVRLENYLTECNIDTSMVTIYDGGVAPCAPLSDQFHSWDFLFDRKDLVTKQKVHQGCILSPEEYHSLVNEFNTLSEEERESRLLTILRSYSLTPLSALRKKLKDPSCADILIFLGGPVTALLQLFEEKGGDEIRPKVVALYGMFGALEPGKSTLLQNQFNVACDVEAAADVFTDNLFAHSDEYLITTEVAKSKNLLISSADLQNSGICSHVVELQRLWESIHNDKPQPLFDVLPVMAYLEEFRGSFEWSRKKAVLQEWRLKGKNTKQIFCFVDSDDQKQILVSTGIRSINSEMFLEFVLKVWR